MTSEITLPLGITDDGNLVADPYPNASRLVIGPSGSSKTTSVVVPTVQGLIGNSQITVKIDDPKDGEVFGQLVPLAKKYDRLLGAIDDFDVHGFDNPHRLHINPLGAVVSAATHYPQELIFTIQSATHNIIPEVNDGGRNFPFRETPRQEIHLGLLALAEMKLDLLTPGVLYETIANPDTWRLVREAAVHDGSPALKARAQLSLDMQDWDAEAYFKHLRAALTPLQIYEPGSVLNMAGADATITHEELCQGGWIVCNILPQRHARRVGTHFSLHQQSFMEAQLSGRGGRLINIIDEMCNSPQKDAVERVTIQRSYGMSTLYIAQTLADIEKQYGKHELSILMDNCPVVQYLSFSSYDEAEKVSLAMGEEISVSQSLGLNAERLEISGNLNTGKQRVMTATELMNLDPAYQVIHMKGYGWLVCRKLIQNQIGPTCHHLGLNVLEGNRRLPPDPKITLPVHSGSGR